MIDETILIFRAIGQFIAVPIVACVTVCVEIVRQVRDGAVSVWRAEIKTETPQERQARLEKERNERRTKEREARREETRKKIEAAKRRKELQIVGGVQELEDGEEDGIDILDFLEPALASMPNQADAKIVRTLMQKTKNETSAGKSKSE
jgi:hypothetical protein